MNKFYFISTLFLLMSCSQEDKKESIKEEEGVVYSGLNTIKTSVGGVKDMIVESDSVKNQKKLAYYASINKSYPEFEKISKLFTSSSPYILEKGGEIYRVKELKITDDGTIIHNHVNDNNEVLYFYLADNNYYIYTFDISKKSKPEFKALRRIKRGKFSQPVHDLIFENDKLIKEDFVADVSKDFYSKDGIQYFEIEKKDDNGKVVNQYNLGQKRDF
ncbi:hypothetical protein OBK22_06365 [Empedobacter falsenii]